MHKSIIIFGASSGLGKASAEHLSKKGWNVFAVARSHDKLAALAADNPGINTKTCDVSDLSQVEDVFVWATGGADTRKKQTIDAILMTAGGGFYHDIPMEKFTREMWNEAIETNIFGTNNIGIGAKKLFRRQRHGTLFVIGSKASLNQDVLGGRVAYSATKHAQSAIAESVNAEMTDEEIPARAIIVCPGMIPGTPMVEKYEATHEVAEEDITPLATATELLCGLIVNPEGHSNLIYLLDKKKLSGVPKYDKLPQLTGA